MLASLEERFTGHFGAGWQKKAHIAGELFPDARIILTVRRPADLLLSNYLQHLRHPRPGHPPIGRFDKWVEMTLSDAKGAKSYARTLQFDDIVTTYIEIFGEKAVHVMVFEAFKHDPSVVLAELAKWMGVEAQPFLDQISGSARVHNPAPTRAQYWIWLQRQTAILNDGPAAKLFGLAERVGSRIPVRPAVKVPEKTQAMINDFASDQCAKLAVRRNLDLGKWGYPV